MRLFTVEFEGVAVSTAVDLFELTAADDAPIEVIGLMIAQSSDVGDAASEMLRYRIIRGHTTSGAGGATATPVRQDPKMAAAAFTAETNNTTAASAGTAVNYHSGAFHIAGGEDKWWPEGAGARTTQADGLIVVRLMAAPADPLTMSGTIYVAEL